MGAYLTLGITKDVLQNAMAEGPQYARLLALTIEVVNGSVTNTKYH